MLHLLDKFPAYANKTGGNPFSGIRNAKQVNAAKHNVMSSKHNFARNGVLYFLLSRVMFNRNDTMQIMTFSTKLIIRIALFSPKKPNVKNARMKML